MAHLHLVEDSHGDVVDQIIFCSDFCNQDYCLREGVDYQGWFGCQEISITEPCANCESEVQGVEPKEAV
jgi:hypothetical protein